VPQEAVENGKEGQGGLLRLKRFDLSVAIGLSVGALYTIGAVVTVGQLRGAKLAVRDTLPLVPLSQILGLGMSVVLKPFAGLLAIAAVFAAIAVVGPRVEGAIRRRWPQRERAIRATVVVSGVALLALVSPWETAIVVLGCASVFGAWILQRISLARALLLFCALAVGVLASVSFYRPEPLATATITRDSGEIVRGPLISTVAGRWYVGTGRRTFVAVESSDARSVQITSSPPSREAIMGLLWRALRE
jgi:hypothetical protein